MPVWRKSNRYQDKVTTDHTGRNRVRSYLEKGPPCADASGSSLASPDSETIPNKLVLVAHGLSGDLQRLADMKISMYWDPCSSCGFHSCPELPNNMFLVDTAIYERTLFNTGERPAMLDPKTGKLRQPNSTFSLENVLRTLTDTEPDGRQVAIRLPDCMMHNSGNDAFMCLFALQKLLEPGGTKVPSVKKGWIGRPGAGPHSTGGLINDKSIPVAYTGFAVVGSRYDLAGEMTKIQMEARRRSKSPGPSHGASPVRRRSAGPTSGVWGNAK